MKLTWIAALLMISSSAFAVEKYNVRCTIGDNDIYPNGPITYGPVEVELNKYILAKTENGEGRFTTMRIGVAFNEKYSKQPHLIADVAFFLRRPNGEEVLRGARLLGGDDNKPLFVDFQFMNEKASAFNSRTEKPLSYNDMVKAGMIDENDNSLFYVGCTAELAAKK